MNVVIPIPCPSCGGKMYLVSYEAPLRILKERSWQICKECGFERSTDEFKKMLCCA
jgi:C4-type Zn-finger protein